jgi:UPF0716 protein FxsA
MAMRFFLLYVVIEMAVIVALTYAIGFGWTVLLLAGAFLLGLMLAGSQIKKQIAVLQRGMREPGAGVTDGALVALGGILVMVPGLVTSAAGLLLLLPPTRAAMRPLAGVLATRALANRVAFVDLTGRPAPGPGNYIDGEVIEVHDVPDGTVSATKYLAQSDETAAQRPHP